MKNMHKFSKMVVDRLEKEYLSPLDYKKIKMRDAAKARSIQNNIPFNISEEDIHFPIRCPLLGIEINYNRDIISDDSPSLDRIQPPLGYVKDNVWVISQKANRIKNNGSPGEIMKVALGLRRKIQEVKTFVDERSKREVIEEKLRIKNQKIDSWFESRKETRR